MDVSEVQSGLRGFVAASFGSGARLESVTESDGHAGLTFLFSVREDGGAVSDWVIKLPPKGVRRRGNTDVLRQAPLLRALKAAALPVPDVPWACDDNEWFEVPFIVMERLPGHTFFIWEPNEQVPADSAVRRTYWEQSVQWLARVHAFDWRAALPDWEQPAALEHEITRWERIYAQAPEPAWIAAAEATERALLDSLPQAPATGLFHGDYQPGNCLFRDGGLVGIIDWELSGIGAQLLDVGWLCMVADPANWTPGWMPLDPPPLARVRAIYEDEFGAAIPALPWFHALANYRLGCISCLNVKLHRSGQRHDPIWEHNARSVMPMFDNARRLVA